MPTGRGRGRGYRGRGREWIGTWALQMDLLYIFLMKALDIYFSIVLGLTYRIEVVLIRPRSRRYFEKVNDMKNLKVVFNSNKAGKQVEMEWEALPEASQIAIINYGCQRFINDKLGGSDLGTEEAGIRFDSILENLKSGWTGRQVGASLKPQDPLEAALVELASGTIKAALKGKGFKLSDPEVKGKMKELIPAFIEKNRNALLPQAKQMVAAAEATAALDFDLGL